MDRTVELGSDLGVEFAAVEPGPAIDSERPPSWIQHQRDGAQPSEVRYQARQRAFHLRWRLEDGDRFASAELDRLIEEAEQQEWPEVVRAGLYSAVHRARIANDGSLAPAIDRMREQAESDGDPTSIALALTFEMERWLIRQDPGLSAEVDRELARVTVMLEAADGWALERVAGHNRCAIMYGQRHLWELADEQYAVAERLLTECESTRHKAALLFNRAEAELDWACVLREIGDLEGVAARCRTGAEALRATGEVVMPPSWRSELAVIGVLLGAVGGKDNSEQARTLIEDHAGGAEYAGHLHLAMALAPDSVGAGPAAEAAALAAELTDPVTTPSVHDLALCVASELEAARGGGDTAGLRYAKRQRELRWGTRLSTLATMRNLIQAERSRVEHALLRRDAFLDELTGLANRRGFHQYVSGLVSRDVEKVAMLLVDVDAFKSVNDNYGHATGDATLARLANILAKSVRPGDLAVRIGGDEFVILLADTEVDVARDRAHALLVAMVSEPWWEIHPDLQVTVCIGIAAGHPSRIDELAARADAALYRAKAAGGGRYATS
jgi:diguanylate cyclase (GGDEF)-like protein